MTISKRKAAFMLAVNAVYLTFGICTALYLHEGLFKDFARPPLEFSKFSLALSALIPGLIALVIYVGMFWVQRTFKESRWVRSGLVVFFCTTVIVFLLPMVAAFWNGTGLLGRVQILIYALIRLCHLYLYLTFAFVKNKTIRKYFWGFAGMMLFCDLATYFGPTLYDDFGYSWLLLNAEVIYYVPFLFTLTMFVEMLNLSRRKNEETPVSNGIVESEE